MDIIYFTAGQTNQLVRYHSPPSVQTNSKTRIKTNSRPSHFTLYNKGWSFKEEKQGKKSQHTRDKVPVVIGTTIAVKQHAIPNACIKAVTSLPQLHTIKN
jgi:hypothetical protein